MLRIAISPNNPFTLNSIENLLSIGIQISLQQNKYPLVRSKNFPVEVLFLTSDEVLAAVAAGVSDLGIVGEHQLMEKALPVEVIRKFPASKSNLSLAIPKDTKYRGIEWFTGKKIATPYPETLTTYLKSRGVRAQVFLMNSIIPYVPELGVADAIFDVINSETMLIKHQLREVEVMMQTSPILISNSWIAPQKQIILDELLVRLDALLYAADKKIVTMHIDNKHVNEIIDILSPEQKASITPLANKERSIVQVFVNEKRFWDSIQHLKELGASNICVLDISKMIP